MRNVIDPLVYDWLVKTGSRFNNAANSGDIELAIAVITKCKQEADSYLLALKEGLNGTK